MILFTIRKAIVIYRVSSLVICWLLFSSGLKAQTDINSYCFERSVKLKSVERSIDFLLLPKDTINLREEDSCIDIITSGDRGKLFEKFLSGRYNLRRERGATPVSNNIDNNLETCQLVLRKTNKQKKETQVLKAGEQNEISKSEQILSNTSSMEMVLGQGVPGELEAGSEKIKVICRFTGPTRADLHFSFTEKEKGGVSSEVIATRGEWLNIGSVLKDLNDKNKTLGIPQTEMSTTTGSSETIYELKIK